MARFLLTTVCLAFLALDGAYGRPHLRDEAFLQWGARYLGGTENDVELAEVYATWRDNAAFVERHNSRGLSYKLSLNKFAHMSKDEFYRFTGHQTRAFDVDKPIQKASPQQGIPPEVDWRKHGVVPPVINQGQCGSSGAFAFVEAIDSFHAIKAGKLVLASVTEFADCCETNCGCDGGLLDRNAYECVVKIGGLAGQDYSSSDCSCRNDSYKPVVKINGGKDVLPRANETALAIAVEMQPVAVLIDASRTSFQLYRSGIYNDPDCSSTHLDHALLVVGYGVMEEKEYWICQNSWGASWGMDGYILMARNKHNLCGIATSASYPY